MNRSTATATTALLLLALSVRSQDAAAQNGPAGRTDGEAHTELSASSWKLFDASRFLFDHSVFAEHLAFVLREAGRHEVSIKGQSLDVSNARELDALDRMFYNDAVSYAPNRRNFFNVSFVAEEKSGKQDTIHCTVSITPDPCMVQVTDCKKDFLFGGFLKKRMAGFSDERMARPRNCADVGVAPRPRQEILDDSVNDDARLRENGAQGALEEGSGGGVRGAGR